MLKLLLLLATTAAFAAVAQNSYSAESFTQSPTITNLHQLTQSLDADERVIRNVDLEATVAAASDPSVGAVILQDATGMELVEWGRNQPRVSPGEKIHLRATPCFLRRRDFGITITAAPIVDNDGVHIAKDVSGEITLKAGRHPIQLDWFNQLRDFSLEVTWQPENGEPKTVAADLLSHANGTDFLPGLNVESYEGNWEIIPDFELLKPVKTGVANKFNPEFTTQAEMSGLRFTGFFNAPQDGKYIFHTRSDDGSLLFVENLQATVSKIGTDDVLTPTPSVIGEPMADLDERRWVSVDGRITFARTVGRGVEFELCSERDSMRVRIADAPEINPAALLNSRVRMVGVGRGVFNLDRRIILGQLFAATVKELKFLDSGVNGAALPSVLTTAQEVQTLRLEYARSNLLVHIRGVVTSKGPPYDLWLSIQDETRGIFVDLHAISNAVPVCGESWDIIGHSGAGDFAPVVVADSGTRLGIGRMPEPARPAWNELINGSMDVQWAEFQGLVTDVHTNTLSLLLAGGELDVQMEGHFESQLKQFEKSVVRIRGVLYAAWNTGTREVHVGNILMRNAIINVDIPAPNDPFDAVLKTPRELLLFDAQATAFRRVKVRGQIIHAEPGRVFLTANGAGLRVLPAGKVDVHAGDMVEAVGYPEISDTSLFLREAIIRRTDQAPLPLRPAKILAEDSLTQEGSDSTLVHVTGKLLGSHFEYGSHVLEMQSGTHLYLARMALGVRGELSLRAGSELGLDGVYLAQKRNRTGVEAESFELLLNSPSDITVLSQPSWWTLRRLLVVVGLLLVVLMFSVAWITQLRRLVEQRTAQLHRETRERERVERARALEAERSRIARDLHDDLGSSLTEIGVLASAGQRSPSDTNTYPTLFRNIAGKARSLIAALDVIVWAVDPEDNSLQSVADYLSGFAGEYLSASGTACRFKIPVTFPDVTLNGRLRHGLLMAVKETLNNIVRHSDATEVVFSMGVVGDDLEILITDNGKGFDPALVRDGHGLKNLPARLEKIGGMCSVDSRVGGGTTVAIRFPLSTSDETEIPS